MNIVQRAIAVLTQPRAFFRGLKRENGVRDAFVYFLVLSFAFLVVHTVISMLLRPMLMTWVSAFLGAPPQKETSAMLLIMGMIFSYVLGLGLIFVYAGILHVWILIFGGKAGYAKTLQLLVYSATPSYLFGWIPLVGVIASICSLVFLIIGTQEVHGISKLKSILMYVMPVVILLISFVLLFFGLWLLLSQAALPQA